MREFDQKEVDSLVHAQDAYIRTHKAELEAELPAMRSTSHLSVGGGVTPGGAPLSKSDWLQWFQDPDNQATFQLRARKAREGERQVHNQRLAARQEMPHEAPRLQAVQVARALPWWRHLPSGFYTITEGLSKADADSGTRPRKAAILLISAASQHWGLELHMAANGTGFMFPLANPSPEQKKLVPL